MTKMSARSLFIWRKKDTLTVINNRLRDTVVKEVLLLYAGKKRSSTPSVPGLVGKEAV